MPADGPLLLLDSASLYFRAFFGVPSSVRSPDGLPVNAVRGFLDMISTLVVDRGAGRLVACWDDDWRPGFRVRALPSYKAHRVARPEADVGEPGVEDGPWQERVPPELSAQVPVIVQVLAAAGVARVGAPGYEADDVIGTLATRAAAGGGRPVEVVTGDRDLFQLVDDAAGVRVLYTAKGVRDLTVVDQAWLGQRYGVTTGAAYADLATLRGDPSDGLPGVPGVGEKTAAGLLSRFGDLAALRAAARDGDPLLTAVQVRRLREASSYLDAAPGVVAVVRDLPLGEVDGALPAAPADPAALERLAERWGLNRGVRRLVEVLTAAARA
jgi:5'-3' exonuclease